MNYKKIIATSLISLLLPFAAFAEGVTIENVSVAAGTVTANGTASYNPAILDDILTPLDESMPAIDTLTVNRDGENVFTGTNVNPWMTSFNGGRVGNHEVTATVGGVTTSMIYRVPGGGGIFSPLANYCGFLSGAAFQNCSQTTYTKVIPYGDGCMYFNGCKSN